MAGCEGELVRYSTRRLMLLYLTFLMVDMVVNSFRLGKQDQASEGGDGLWEDAGEERAAFKSIRRGGGGSGTFGFDSFTQKCAEGVRSGGVNSILNAKRVL